MEKKNFVLHYPDGVVTHELRAEIKPDAFLFDQRVEEPLWIALGNPVKRINIFDAMAQASLVKVNGHSCHLPDFIALWNICSELSQINEFLKDISFQPWPVDKYWAKPNRSTDKRMQGINCADSVLKLFTNDGWMRVAFYIPVIEVNIAVRAVGSRAKEDMDDAKVKLAEQNLKKLSKKTTRPLREIKRNRK